MLYTKDGLYPKPIPERIRLSDGSTRTDSSTFTPEEIADAGFTLAPDKPVITEYQHLSWNGTAWVVTDYTDEEMLYLVNNHRQSVAADRYAQESEALEWIDPTDSSVWYIDNNLDSQQRLTSIKTAIDAGLSTGTKEWKLANAQGQVVFRTTTNAEINQWVDLSLARVETCFAVEAVCNQKMDTFVASSAYTSALSVDFDDEYAIYTAP
jgi:hypothetical protein